MKKIQSKWIHALILLAVICPGTLMAASTSEFVVLQVGAYHRFLYAGYYAAQAKGYYEDEGLDVAFRLWDTTTSIIDAVVLGKAQFGADNSRIIEAWSEAKPVISLAVMLQQSPAALMAHSEITLPGQLKDYRVALNAEWALDLQTMLRLAGVRTDSVILIDEQKPEILFSKFYSGQYQAISGDLSTDPYMILQQSKDFNVLPVNRYGVDFYGACLFTTRYEIETNSDRAVRFTRASIRGWEYALAHRTEMVEYIQSHFETPLTFDELVFESKAIVELNQGTRVSVGDQDVSLWQRDADLLTELVLIAPVNVDRFVFSVDRMEREQRNQKLQKVSIVAGVAIALTLIFSFLSLWFWMRVRKRNSELRKNEQRLQQALSATMDAVWDWSESGSKMWWSPVGYELLKIDPKMTKPKWEILLERLHPQDRASIQNDFSQAVRTQGTISRDLRVMIQNQYRWIRVRGAHRIVQGQSIISGVFQDVHDLIEADIARQESESRFRQYFELGLVGMATLATDGRFVQVNKTFCDLLEMDERQMLQSTWMQFTHGKDVQLELDLMESVKRGDRHGYNLDKRFVSIQGKVIHALVSVRGISDATNSKGVHWVMLVQDISRRREGEQEKERILHQLSLKNKTLEDMLHTIGHDFRSPLVNVLWYAQELEKDLISKNWDDVQSHAPAIISGAKTLDRMLTGILALSRLGRQSADSKSLDMNRLVHGVLEELNKEVAKQEAVIETLDMPKVYGNEALLYQVWKHLVVNALQFRDPQRPLRITISGRQIRDWNVYSISDTGTGIPNASLGHIFAPFFKLDVAGKSERDGLGLAFVTRILETHRGHITVESELGKGSLFSFYLPCL